jgi:magnesium transporter
MESAPQSSRSEADLQSALEEITAVLERHRVLDLLAHRQETPNRAVVEQLQRRQNLVDMQRRVRALHPADLAFILESLPPADRLLLWKEIDARQAAETLVELSPVPRQSLIEATGRERLVEIVGKLDMHDLAWLSDALPEGVMQAVSDSLESSDRDLLQESIAFPEDSVGHLMTREVGAVRDSDTVAGVLADLRERAQLPAYMDRLFVIDARHILRGAVSLQALILGHPDELVSSRMDKDPVRFQPNDTAVQAARAFERYDLVSAPVVTERGKLLGRLTVDSVMDFVRRSADSDALAMAGLRGGEDLFASVWHSARNRSPWLLVNLITAFVASRFIGLFESTIQQLVALATLMPVVASIGGNTGNQTIALVIRGLAMDQLPRSSTRHLLRKELNVSILSGVMWGGLVGVFAAVLYRHLALGLVMAGAVLLNLVIAAIVGVAVPLSLHGIGRDPAQGSSVLLTFVTDSMGFLLFLGLARLFL